MKKKQTQVEYLQDLVKRYQDALIEISKSGDGIKESIIDWGNIGKNAKYIAKKSLYIPCKACGK